MAVYKIFPTKDSTIYSRYPKRNTGLDSILEVSADYATSTPQVSRYLIQFDQTSINSIFNDKISDSVYQINLKNYICNINNLNLDTTLEVYATSGSWGMGTGHFNDTPETQNGCNWKYKSYEGEGEWTTSNFSTYVTASYGQETGGGTWYTGSSLELNVTQSQVYSYNSNKDLNVNVTNILRNWYSASNSLGGFPNDGFMVKLSKNDEFIANRNEQPNIKFYSVDTNTIYPPELQFQWDDRIYATSSAIPTITTTDIVATLDNNPGTFKRDSIHKFKINCRPQFPTRVYQTSSLYTQRNYLPTSSYYAVKDLDTNEFVISFDDIYTKLSADDSSNYFTLYMNGLEPERYYKILLKIVLEGETIILDDNYYFKIING